MYRSLRLTWLAIAPILGILALAHADDSITEFDVGEAVLRPISRIEHEMINECSGIVHHDDAFWVHNDSGDDAILYRSPDLHFTDVEVLKVPDAGARDWEEITVFDGDLLACDIGDNARKRDHVSLYRVRYVPGTDTEPGRMDLVATYRVRYPDASHDAEAAFEQNDRLHIVVKDRGEGTLVFRFDELRDIADLGPDEFNVPTLVGTLDLDGEQVTAGACDPETGTVVLLTYASIVRYPDDRFDGRPESSMRIWAKQCEALCLCGPKLIFTNEQRDVYVIDDYLDRRLGAAIPPRGTSELARHPGNVAIDGQGGSWRESAATVTLQGASNGESLAWTLAGDRLLLHARLATMEDLAPVRVDTPSVGSSLLLMFAREPRAMLDRQDAVLVIGVDTDGEPGAWWVDLTGAELGVTPFDGATVHGRQTDGTFEFEASLPAAAVLGEPLPEAFLFDLRGIRLRDGDPIYFSSPGPFAARRPFVWGDVKVVRTGG